MLDIENSFGQNLNNYESLLGRYFSTTVDLLMWIIKYSVLLLIFMDPSLRNGNC
jgi:hypothetical protein